MSNSCDPMDLYVAHQALLSCQHARHLLQRFHILLPTALTPFLCVIFLTRFIPDKNNSSYSPEIYSKTGGNTWLPADKTSEITQALSLSMVHLFPSFSTFSINHTRYDFQGQPLHGFTQQMP